MSVFRLSAVTVSLLVLISAPVLAQDDAAGGWAIDVTAGSLGIGADLNRSIVPGFLNVRAGASFFSYSTDLDISGVRYDSSLKLGAVPVALDVFPFRNWFRVGGGIIINLNKVSGNTLPSSIVQHNGEEFNIDDFGRIDADIEFNRVTPYLGVGFNNPIKRTGRLGFFADIGFMYHGTPTATLTPSRSDPLIQADIDQEMRDINADIRDFKIFPVIKLGISYRF